jgi:micrococcal nuclease
MTRTRATLFTSILTAAILAAVAFLYEHFPQIAVTAPAVTPGFYKVTHITDGDTIEVDMAGTTEKIRMIGVDTPETKKPNAPVQCFGPQASDFTKQTLTGKNVRLEADPTNDNRDRYGRLLRYVYLEDGTLHQEALIAQGYSFAYTVFTFQKAEPFTRLQREAQQAKRGLWAACTATFKNDRWQTNDL